MVGGQPHAYYGARISHLDTHPGYLSRQNFGVAASGIPLLVGLQRMTELRAGHIDHVVSFAMKDPQQGFRWPAQRSDAIEHARRPAAQEGTCFRLPPRSTSTRSASPRTRGSWPRRSSATGWC